MILHMQFQAQDIIAVILIITVIIGKICGIDGTFDTILGTIAGYYFGRRFSDIAKTNAQT